jgi:hypothetical protein
MIQTGVCETSSPAHAFKNVSFIVPPVYFNLLYIRNYEAGYYFYV